MPYAFNPFTGTLDDAFDPAAPGAIGGTTPSTGQFTALGLGGVAPRTGYSAALGSAIVSRAAVVTAVAGTYTIDIRAASRFFLAAAIAGDTTIEFINLADLVVSGGVVPFVELQIDFLYTSGIIALTGAGYTLKWDGNTAAIPTAGEREQLVVQITPAIAGTPFTTPTIKVAAMRGNT